jgi:hypothetical protein
MPVSSSSGLGPSADELTMNSALQRSNHHPVDLQSDDSDLALYSTTLACSFLLLFPDLYSIVQTAPSFSSVLWTTLVSHNDERMKFQV